MSELSESQQELGLEDLMETVMTYKCKFCDFTDHQSQIVALHARSSHMAVVTTSDAQALAANQSQRLLRESQPTTQTDTIAVQIDQRTEDTVSQTISTVLPSIAQSANLHVAPIQYISTSTSTNTDNVSQTEVVKTASKPTASLVSQAFETAQAEDTRAVDEMNVDMRTLPISSEQETDSTSSIAPGITQELFLCGQCSIGFNNVDDCKMHMVDAHNAILPASGGCTLIDEELPEVGQSVPAEKVSVSTQVDMRKKPGRKLKSEMVRAPPSPASSEEEMVIVSGGTRSRSRRIKIPKSLKKEYYLQKPKIKTRETSHLKTYTFKCSHPACVARFQSEATKGIHAMCHRDEGYGFKCYQCEQLTTKWREMRLHLWKTHKTDTDLLSCEMCGFKTDVLHRLRIHQEIHSESRPYSCDQCGKGFKQLSQMHNHRILHSISVPSEPATTKCNVCDRSFKTPKCLSNHLEAVHYKSRLFACSYCNYTSTRKAMWISHMRTHTGEKPFKCDQCQYVTADHNSLRRHKMRHSGVKQYQCQYCAYSCIQAISMKCHMKNKHPNLDGVFVCELCQYRSVNKANYQQHIRDHELGLVPVVPSSNVIPNSTLISDQSNETVAITRSLENNTAIQTTEAHISKEDLAKLTANYEGLVASDVGAAQLIYSALNAMSQNVQPSNSQPTPHVLDSVQTTISEQSEEGGVTTHTITFHLAGPDDTPQEVVEHAPLAGEQQVLFTQALQVLQKQEDGTESQVVETIPYSGEIEISPALSQTKPHSE